MHLIKTYQKTGYAIHPDVLSGIVSCGASSAVFSSKTDKPGWDRENFFHNYIDACNYRDDKDYSILMTDNTIITKEV